MTVTNAPGLLPFSAAMVAWVLWWPAPLSATPPRHLRLPAGSLHIKPVHDPGKIPKAIETPFGQARRPRDGGPSYTAKSSAQGHQDNLQGDSRTEREGRLDYSVVFNPSVAPFKREMVYMSVEADGSLSRSTHVAPKRARGGAERERRELFIGTITVSAPAQAKVLLPSVAPSSRLLSIVTSPNARIQLWRDTAGLWQLSSPSPLDGVKVQYLMDAPSHYFGAKMGPGPTTRDPWRPTLTRQLQARMRDLWGLVGVHEGQNRRQQVRALTRYFREFQPHKGDPKRTIDDVIRGQHGVCRHRARGFVLIAHSLGVPTNYVANEAHAFVEVWVRFASGEEGWMRVDLGGGADELHLHKRTGRRLHQPLSRDDLPRPSQYTSQGGSVTGLRGMAGARRVVSAGMMHAPLGSRPLASKPSQRPEVHWLMKRAMDLTRTTKKGRSPDPYGRLPTLLTLTAPANATVGQRLTTKGQLRGAGRLHGKPVEVWLVRPHTPTQGMKVAMGTTQAAGRFEVTWTVPQSIALGAWDLVAYFRGDERWAPSYSREPPDDAPSGR